MICIDQTRVVLKGEEESDFIHANRVPLGENHNEVSRTVYLIILQQKCDLKA